MPFGIGGKGKKRIVIRKYTALTEGGARKEYEKDANRLAQEGYRPTSSVDHGRGNWIGVQMMVTYELVESAANQAAPVPAPQAARQAWPQCSAVSADGWQCALANGHPGAHRTTTG